MSLISVLSRSGSRIDPCGTPENISLQVKFIIDISLLQSFIEMAMHVGKRRSKATVYFKFSN